ncbi:hypothetical protein KsCSTR_17720 [Candidatus Kuenenia stuttgartiensis]|uniref:Uncharacterized protein n=1 Tax=Kuenenia stuttgartiensis TaxID=174633 RepID=Q1Q279_KUEST|nr:hypothetical protein KsCSTR_17720 [Candidatus Kuenenia stuttgartiensis]CAJ74121.1 unknown protein [Candidatus Kuenenia stuttgartiensis]SOH03285.1 hypothetical protein KSMBR1_0774 [Candidatus Kuenenia stuttgartiensis]
MIFSLWLSNSIIESKMVHGLRLMQKLRGIQGSCFNQIILSLMTLNCKLEPAMNTILITIKTTFMEI